jgi:hypothetical protein
LGRWAATDDKDVVPFEILPLRRYIRSGVSEAIVPLLSMHVQSSSFKFNGAVSRAALVLA